MSEQSAKRMYFSIGSKAVPLLILFGMLAYCNSFTKVFLFDDYVWIVNNNDIKEYPVEYLRQLQGRVVGAATFLVNYQFSGLRTPGYHAVNLAIHLFAALALFGFVRRTMLLQKWQGQFDNSATQYAFVIALLWLVHPIQTQSVTYIIQRFESLMGMFFLLTMYCFVRATQSANRRHWWYILSLVCCALGMGTKEVTAVAPIVIALYDWVFVSDSWREIIKKRWGFYIGLAGLWAVFLGLRILPGIIATSDERTIGFGLRGITPYEYALSQFGVILHYLYLSFWPMPLTLDYIDWPVTRSWTDAVVPALIILSLVGATLWALWRKSWLGFAGVWFFFILAPTSSIMPIRDLVFEHRMYLSLAAVIALVVFGGARVIGKVCDSFGAGDVVRTVVTFVIVGVVAAFMSVRTYLRNEDYRSGQSMWGDVIAKRPNAARAYISYANTLDATEKDEAIRILNKAIQLVPTYYLSHNNLAVLLWDEQQTSAAMKHINLAAGYAPDRFEKCFLIRGYFHYVNGDFKAAAADFREAINRKPRQAQGYAYLGTALMELGKKKDANKAYAKSLELDPDAGTKPHRNARTIIHMKKPRATELAKCLFFAKQANDLAKGENPEFLITLADAYAVNDQFPMARATAQRAQMIASETNDTHLQRLIERKLTQFCKKKLPKK